MIAEYFGGKRETRKRLELEKRAMEAMLSFRVLYSTLRLNSYQKALKREDVINSILRRFRELPEYNYLSIPDRVKKALSVLYKGYFYPIKRLVGKTLDESLEKYIKNFVSFLEKEMKEVNNTEGSLKSFKGYLNELLKKVELEIRSNKIIITQYGDPKLINELFGEYFISKLIKTIEAIFEAQIVLEPNKLISLKDLTNQFLGLLELELRRGKQEAIEKAQENILEELKTLILAQEEPEELKFIAPLWELAINPLAEIETGEDLPGELRFYQKLLSNNHPLTKFLEKLISALLRYNEKKIYSPHLSKYKKPSTVLYFMPLFIIKLEDLFLGRTELTDFDLEEIREEVRIDLTEIERSSLSIVKILTI